MDTFCSLNYIDQEYAYDYKHVWSSDYEKLPEYELYDVISDPDCLINLSGNPEYLLVEWELKEELIQELKRSEDPRIL